ncbi:sodium channel subunit beta-3-like [Myxocyprinus asiaticus]|uniref:sodium channel subunit beta-3-like n=1 Tax=Myxocyprinus asiaticus TaxID=70543 RepID=UPI002222971B|nr:sodium channel subunit beta-3-like [Myxocyprinus asiaticus]XP_051521789.1 sodium channel subunit beta-3-like [Myxocyprinus asiaticus]
MAARMRVALRLLLLYIFAVQEGWPVCVDVPSDTEAVVGNYMKLTCIYCMKREEIAAITRVNWFYIGPDDRRVLIYQYDGNPREPEDIEEYWRGRLAWNGSKDLQDVSIVIQKVNLNDTGKYECVVFRLFEFDSFMPSATKTIEIKLEVKEKASQDTTALYSEIMMYVLLVFLTFWLLVEMIYCYSKISKSDEQAQDNATDYLAIPSENKENPGPAVME